MFKGMLIAALLTCAIVSPAISQSVLAVGEPGHVYSLSVWNPPCNAIYCLNQSNTNAPNDAGTFCIYRVPHTQLDNVERAKLHCFKDEQKAYSYYINLRVGNSGASTVLLDSTGNVLYAR